MQACRHSSSIVAICAVLLHAGDRAAAQDATEAGPGPTSPDAGAPEIAPAPPAADAGAPVAKPVDQEPGAADAGAAAQPPPGAAPPAPTAAPQAPTQASPTPQPASPTATPSPAPTPTAPTTPAPQAEVEEPPPAPAGVGHDLPLAPPRLASERGERDTVPAQGDLYVRLAAGAGFPFGFDISDRYEGLDEERVRLSGFSFATDLMVGTTLASWAVVGGGAVSDTVTGGSVKERDGRSFDLERALYFALVGPFVDIYPSGHDGFHVQALIGIAHLSRARNLGDHEATGLGAAIAVGYEWRVSRGWNVGVLGRMTLAPLSMDDVGGVARSPTLYQPTLMLTATMRP